MSYNIFILPKSEREIKRLNKKYRSLKADLSGLFASLQENPQQGEPLGRDCYKVRMSISAKGKGKSGGARIITCVKIVQETIYVLSVYDKSEADSIADEEINDRLTSAGL